MFKFFSILGSLIHNCFRLLFELAKHFERTTRELNKAAEEFHDKEIKKLELKKLNQEQKIHENLHAEPEKGSGDKASLPINHQATIKKTTNKYNPRLKVSEQKINDSGSEQKKNIPKSLVGSEKNFQLARLYEKGEGVPKNTKMALDLYRAAANDGMAKAQIALGFMYDFANGVPQNYDEALKWYRLAADQGLAFAQLCVGGMYLDGKGVLKNDEQAVEWFRLAALQGLAKAQSNLGGHYFDGKGVQQDHKEAFKWYQLAAEQGDASGQTNLGYSYENGYGVSQNHKKANHWYQLAAEQGDAVAQYNCGYLSEEGKGTPSNFKDAIRWYRLAAEQGFEPAQSSLNNLTTYCNKKQYEESVLDKIGVNYIYHMSHIDNLEGILNYGLLPHKNEFTQQDISNSDVNNRRTKIEPINKKAIHEYVPFYFNPTNAMLYALRDIEDSVLILAIDRSLIYQGESLFTDGNAASDATKFYTEFKYLHSVDWECVRGTYWNDYSDGKRKKMAEVLIPNIVNNTFISKIYCNSYKSKNKIESVLNKKCYSIDVEVNSDLYFN